jgi:uncharacterized protein (TIGR03032 family)
MTTPAQRRPPPTIELRVHGDFVEWLGSSQGALAVTTYNSGKLAFFSANNGELTARVWRFPRPMGVAFNAGRLALAIHTQIHIFRIPFHGDAHFDLEATYHTGRVDVHDIAFGVRGLYFVNTRCNCLARPSERVTFVRSWQPWFVDRSVRRDACHLNGLGMRNGRPSVATAFRAAGHHGAWREGDRFTSGVVIDVRKNRVLTSGLCMPHSPRWHAGRWWLCDSGAGALSVLDPRRGACKTIATLPGFTRGLTFAAGRAIVGLSRIRKEHILDSPLLGKRFPISRSGLALVDPTTGQETGRLEFTRGGREVYDVAFIPHPGPLELHADLVYPPAPQ